jgi:hypothetical protein
MIKTTLSFKKILLLFFLISFGSSQAKQSHISNKIWDCFFSLLGRDRPRTKRRKTSPTLEQHDTALSPEQQQIEAAQAEFQKLSPEEQRKIVMSNLITHASNTHAMRIQQIWAHIKPTENICKEAYADAKNEVKFNLRYLHRYLIESGEPFEPALLEQIQNHADQENQQLFQQCLKDVEN